MTRYLRNAALLTAAMLILAGTCEAQVRLRVVPSPRTATLPQFGMYADCIPGCGLQIRTVSFGSRAWRMGLEPGDLMLSLNGRPLTYVGAWQNALAQATQFGGNVTLAVQDVRTGIVTYRTTNVFDHPRTVHHHTVHPYSRTSRVNSHPRAARVIASGLHSIPAWIPGP